MLFCFWVVFNACISSTQCTVLLNNNVPEEVVSKLLGHSKIQTTQDRYGQIVEKRISLEMEKLKGSA